MGGLLQACGPGASPVIERWFRDCIYNSRDMLGFSLGMASICCWLVAQMPQLYKNYKTKHAEALSAFFLASWLLGDTFNLVGALLKGDQPPTVVFTAQYFIVVDCVMMVQYIYYTSLQRRRERMLAAPRRHRHHRHHHHHRHNGQQHPSRQQHHSGSGGGELGDGEQQQQQQQQQQHGGGGGGSDREGWGPHAATSSAAAIATDAAGSEAAGGSSSSRFVPVVAAGGRDVSFRPQRVLACLGVLVVVAQLSPQQQEQGLGGGGAELPPRRRLLMASATPPRGGGGVGLGGRMPQWAYTAGSALGYCSSLLYLASRVSQLWKNHQRRSAEGLAMSMFLCAIAANSLYGASILVRSYTAAELRSSLPWLIGSLGTVALDMAIYAQSRLLGTGAAPGGGWEGPKQHPSDEDEPLLTTQC